jgi:amino acid transporter
LIFNKNLSFAMYYLPQPPFLIALLGVFIAVTFGSAFQNLMSQKLRDSYKNPQNKNSFKLVDPVITATYCGICLGVWVFLGGGLFVLGFGIISSFGVALLLTLLTASLVWDQLGEVLLQLKEGGSQALDLE